MIELLRLCGFEAGEIESELSRVKKVFSRLGITDEDIEQGKQRLNKYYDMELEGVRKSIGLCMKELVNTVLARDDGKKKIIYSFMSPGFEILGSALVTKSKEVYVAGLAQLFQFVLGCIFDKMTPILEAAEHKWLKAGKVRHCANPKTIVGLLSFDLIPKPDLIVTSGQLCDTAPKTLDLLHELYDIPTYSLDTVQDREFRDYPNSRRTLDLMTKSLRLLSLKIKDIVGFEITDDTLWESINARNELQQNTAGLRKLLESSYPVPISATHELLWYCVNTLPFSISELKRPTAVLGTLYEELKDRVNKGKGVLNKRAPRVLVLIPHHFSDPRWEHLLYEVGIAEVSSETGFFPMHGERYLDINEDKPTDPYEIIGQGLHSSLCQGLSPRIAIIIEACKRLKVDGVLGRFHVGCRIGAIDALMIKEAITRQLGIPVLLLEWEGFDPRFYNEEQYRKRLELFKEALKKQGHNISGVKTGLI